MCQMNKMNQAEIKKRIEYLMKEFNLETRSSFAESIGMNTSNFYQSMKGDNRTIGVGMIDKIALKFKVNKEWLLTGTGGIYMDEKERRIDKLLANHDKLVEAHIVLVKNSETLAETNKKLVDQNNELHEENKLLRKANEDYLQEFRANSLNK